MRSLAISFILLILLFGCVAQQETKDAAKSQPPPTPQPTPQVQPVPVPTPIPSPQPQPKAEPSPQPKPPELPKPPDMPKPPEQKFEEVIPGKGAGIGFGGDNGPWKHRIKSASSNDGLIWIKDGKIVSDQASVPDAIIDKESNVRVYYVDWKNKGVTAAINKNNEWKYYKVWIKPTNFFDGADPDVVLVDGTYRIYFTKFDSPGSLLGRMEVAFSSDGIIFENQTTAYPKEERITDPDVFVANGKWVMVLSQGPQSILTTSTDGLNFQKQNDLPFKGSVSNTIKVVGGYRMYYHKSTGLPPRAAIYSAFSSDGLTWQEENLRLEASASEESVESPAVVQLPDGSYKMFYHSMIND